MHAHARWLGRTRLVVLGLVVTWGAAAVVPAAPTQAAPVQAAPEVTQTDLPADVVWRGINDRGQVVGSRTAAADANDIVLWEDGEVIDVGTFAAPPSPYCYAWSCPAVGIGDAKLNNRGEVGTMLDGHAVLWRDGQVTDIDGDAPSSWLLDLNDRGQAVVLKFTGTGQHVLGLWSRGRFTELLTGPAVPLLGPPRALLSDSGHVAVNGFNVWCFCNSSFLWHRGERTELGFLLPVDINASGQIAGHQSTLWGEAQRVLWDDGEVTQLPTLGGPQTYVEGMNDRGQVVGISTTPASDGFHTVLWEDGEVTDIGPDDVDDRPVGIDEHGDVLIQANRNETGAGLGLLWRDGRLVPLPPLDDPLVYVEVFRLNDCGQIYGRHWTIGRTTQTIWNVAGRECP